MEKKNALIEVGLNKNIKSGLTKCEIKNWLKYCERKIDTNIKVSQGFKKKVDFKHGFSILGI